MFKLPQTFFTAADCGCPQTGDARAICPTGPAMIADNRYFSLLTAPAVQILGVPLGGNAQAYLKPAANLPGFIVFGPDGQCRIVQQPEISLPPLNPAVSNVFPAPGNWHSIVIATGSDPNLWYTVRAPSAGRFIVQCENGSFTLVDAGSIPGINEVGSGLTTAKGNVLVIVPGDVDGTFVVKKLIVNDKRVMVGDVDGDGVAGYKPLSASDYLEHPKAKIQELAFRQFESVDVDGVLIAGGFEQAAFYGTGAITDAVRMVYSPTSKKLYFPPAHVRAKFVLATSSSSVTLSSTYQLIGGHLQMPSQNFHYGSAMVHFNAAFAAAEGAYFGLFQDGTLIFEWKFGEVAAGQGLISGTYLIDALALGAHTFDIRMKLGTLATGTVIIDFSSITIFTL